MTQDTEDVVARVAKVLNSRFGVGNDEHWPVYVEAAREAIEASDRRSLSDRIDVLEGAVEKLLSAMEAVEEPRLNHESEAITIARAALHQEGIAPK